jgi:hypothetical protein
MVFALAIVATAPSVVVAGAVGDRPQSHPLLTGVYLTGRVIAPDLSRVSATGSSIVRLTVAWSDVAPRAEPSSWSPADPADPNYDWSSLDANIGDIVGAGLEPLVTVSGAPRWAQKPPFHPDPGVANQPDPVAYGQFARAIALRYSGSFGGLPRVRYFQAWNEPNISLYLTPQLVNGRPVAALRYRLLLNAFAHGVHGAVRTDVVAAGGLAPFRDITPSILSQDKDWGPLAFLRTVLCLSPSLRPTCSTNIDADAWAFHPYTSGGPTHHAVLANDLSLGDLPKARAILAAAARAGHLSVPNPQLWVTEFSWDSSPPDPKAVPMSLLTRWVAEGLYRMWQNDIIVVMWLELRDQPLSESFFQSGLLYRNGAPKAILRAFRFPVVGLPRGGGIDVWGRTPGSDRRTVVVERLVGGSWRRLGVLHSDANGIFQQHFAQAPQGWIRARAGGKLSANFSLAQVPDRFFNPFGEPTLLEPKKK